MHNSAIYTDQITGGLNSSGYSLFGFKGPVSSKGADLRVGYDIGSNLDSNFYEISCNVNSNFLDWGERSIWYKTFGYRKIK